MGRVVDISGNSPIGMATDPSTAGVSGPSRTVVTVTPSDTVKLPTGCRGIYVGGAGNVTLVDGFGTVQTFTGVTAGSTLPVAALRINSTNTTATLMKALY